MPDLANFDTAHFLAHHWQQQHLLIRGALPGFEDPLSPEELAGLALEDDIESRLVEFSDSAWTLEHGPFDEQAFDRPVPWSLLVQGVDHHVEAVARLWRFLDFLPDWRRDDVMVSYATAGGGVGPHYDNYDVFLLQGRGRRRWRLGQWCTGEEALVPDQAQRILADFHPSAEYLLEPGDILYVPPRLAHWGEAVSDCMTYSLGFRAPRVNELMSRWLDGKLERTDPELFYTDPPLSEHPLPGEISQSAADRALKLVQECITREPDGIRWLGELLTEQGYGTAEAPPAQNPGMWHSCRMESTARLAWHRAGPAVAVFANGSSFSTGPDCLPLLQELCGSREVDLQKLHTSPHEKAMLELLQQLQEAGCVYGE